MLRTIISSSLAVAFGCASAAAEVAPLPDPSGTGWFYNRSGASGAERDEAEAQCNTFSRAMAGTGVVSGPGGQYGLVGSVIGSIAQANHSAKYPRVVLEYFDDCMIAKGYRRFHVAGVSQEELLRHMSEGESSARNEWAGADTPPQGALARVFANENWLSKPGDAPFAEQYYASLRQTVSAYSFGGFNRPLRDRDAIAPGPGEAVLVSSMAGPRGDFNVTLLQIGQDGRPVVESGGKAVMTVRGRGGRTTTQVFVVPAGRYALGGTGYTMLGRYGNRAYCIRTAAFTIAPGEARHLGDMIVDEPGRREDQKFAGGRFGSSWAPRLRINAPDLAAGRLALARAPALAEKLEPVEWRNGAFFPCTAIPSLFNDIGAFDVPTVVENTPS